VKQQKKKKNLLVNFSKKKNTQNCQPCVCCLNFATFKRLRFRKNAVGYARLTQNKNNKLASVFWVFFLFLSANKRENLFCFRLEAAINARSSFARHFESKA
jgi:hypothetical protein